MNCKPLKTKENENGKVISHYFKPLITHSKDKSKDRCDICGRPEREHALDLNELL
jgi:hypothetical protein